MRYHGWGKRTFALGLLCSVFSLLPGYAQNAWDTATMNDVRTVANGVVSDILARIETYKNRYLVLGKLNMSAISLNQDGFQGLRYSYPLAEGGDLEVNVLILSMDAAESKEMSSWRRLEFPFLRVKVVWSTARTGLYLKGFDLDAIVQDAVWPLVDLQQKHLPLQLSIETLKTTYQVGEPVDLDLVVTNVSKNTLRVKSLDKTTLYCTMDDQSWGTKDQRPAPSKSTLRPGEQMRYLLKLKVLQMPGDFRIVCSYGIGYQGVRPQARKVLKIEGNSIKDN